MNRKSISQSWGTPPELYKKLDEEFKFDHDPCPYPRPDFDGLSSEWGSCNFVNPPFNQLKKWSKKCLEEYKKGKKVILLCPMRSNTNYFHDYILPYCELRFLKGRINFINLDNSLVKLGQGCRPPLVICIYNKGLNQCGKDKSLSRSCITEDKTDGET